MIKKLALTREGQIVYCCPSSEQNKGCSHIIHQKACETKEMFQERAMRIIQFDNMKSIVQRSNDEKQNNKINYFKQSMIKRNLFISYRSVGQIRNFINTELSNKIIFFNPKNINIKQEPYDGNIDYIKESELIYIYYNNIDITDFIIKNYIKHGIVMLNNNIDPHQIDGFFDHLELDLTSEDLLDYIEEKNDEEINNNILVEIVL